MLIDKEHVDILYLRASDVFDKDKNLNILRY